MCLEIRCTGFLDNRMAALLSFKIVNGQASTDLDRWGISPTWIGWFRQTVYVLGPGG